MFRLEDRQLHILLFLILGTSIVLFSILGIGKLPVLDEQGGVEGMTDFSEGWICSYETDDMEKYQEYQSTEDNSSDSKDKIIREVVSFPDKLSVAQGKTLSLFHQVPDMTLSTMYLLMETNRENVKVFVGEDILYQSSEKEAKLPSYHMIPVPLKYKNQMLTIEITGTSGKKVLVNAIYTGTRNQLWVTLLQESGLEIIGSAVAICISLGMLLVYGMMKNTWWQKKLLLYSGLEGMLLGCLFILNSNILLVLTGWNYGIYLLRCCTVILAAIMHLLIIRRFLYKKKVLALLDTGILVFGVYYISAMVLQAFSLVQFDTIYAIGQGLFGISILLYTAALGVSIYDYGQKEGKPVLFANAILILCVVLQLIMQFSGREISFNDIYIPAGFGIYLLFIWGMGLKQALFVKPKKEMTGSNEEAIRMQVVEQLNPNLLFASFHTLQNLIKSGSEKSVRMIYYISVYIRNNLKALEQPGEIIPFENELEHIIAYLQLQKTRNVNLNFAMECKVKEFFVPRHSIEPMVENAVKYGVAGHGNKGNIAIRTYMRAEGYAIQVIDDGIGFDTKQLKRQSPTALLNLLDELKNKCQAQTEVISKEGKGTVITIILPMLENELMEDSE